MTRKVRVQAKTGRAKVSIKEIEPNGFEIAVSAHPIDGAANDAIREVLAHHLHIPKTRIVLKRGHTSKIKWFDVS